MQSAAWLCFLALTWPKRNLHKPHVQPPVWGTGVAYYPYCVPQAHLLCESCPNIVCDSVPPLCVTQSHQQ